MTKSKGYIAWLDQNGVLRAELVDGWVEGDILVHRILRSSIDGVQKYSTTYWCATYLPLGCRMSNVLSNTRAKAFGVAKICMLPLDFDDIVLRYTDTPDYQLFDRLREEAINAASRGHNAD